MSIQYLTFFCKNPTIYCVIVLTSPNSSDKMVYVIPISLLEGGNVSSSKKRRGSNGLYPDENQ
jgi:hypothetical protein